jgi:transcription antitermination factor NusG
MSLNWVLVRSKPSQEERAYTNIQRVRPGMECYVPKFYDPGLRKVRVMFRPYVFVRIEGGIWRFLENCWGVSKVIGSADTEIPFVVPDRDIEKLRAMEDKMGVIRLQLRRWKEGQRLTIKAGPLKFYCGAYVGDSKQGYSRVELDGSFRKVSTEIPTALLETI